MKWDIINNLLDKLDRSVNSNSFWIELGIPKGEFELEKILLQHLKTGNFHFELVKQDVNREWEHYSEIVFSKQATQPTLIQCPGNTWNGIENIDYKEISKDYLSEHLIDILTGEEKFYSKSGLGTQLKNNEAKKIVNNLLKILSVEDASWKAFLIKPNFLNSVDDYFDSGSIKLGYFENCGRDMALGFLINDELNVLLTNGYA